jgi:hypothetical protein
MNTTQPKTKKTDSRKFVVWLIWLILCGSVLVYTFISNNPTLLQIVLKYFFVISMTYLGVNVIQKGVFSITDIFKDKETLKEE